MTVFKVTRHILFPAPDPSAPAYEKDNTDLFIRI